MAALLGVSGLLFALNTLVTILWCVAMAGMAGTRMSAGSFLSMWIVMMVAMMLPSLVPVLGRYHRAVAGLFLAARAVSHF